MDNLRQTINAHLQHYNRDELLALVWDFLATLDEENRADFLNLMRQKPPSAGVETLELEADDELLTDIQVLHDALANEEYVEYGARYDPDYGEYRGFGDDGWIDEMDKLFATATSYYRLGNYQTAAAAYIALFAIFALDGDGVCHFTRPDPPTAVKTDLNLIKYQLFTALGMLNPDPATLVLADTGYDEEDRTLIGLSGNLVYYGDNRYALLDAWASHPDWMHGLEAQLREICREPISQDQSMYGLRHAAELLREWGRRSYGLPERVALCQEIGVPQGWPYQDLITAYQEQGQWAAMLEWADDGLTKLPPQSNYRLKLEAARGTALLRLERPVEAFAALQTLFKRTYDVAVYLTMRAAAQATGEWAQRYPQLTDELEQQVLANVVIHMPNFTSSITTLATLLGYAHLLEGQIEPAVAWALRPDIPTGWTDDDANYTVALGLLRMGVAAANSQPDAVLREALGAAPKLIREQGELLEATARTLSPNTLFNGAVRSYERLLIRAVDRRKRESYAIAGSYAKVIRAIRIIQGRRSDFEAYYQSLFTTYPRLPAFKDELRTAIEGSGYTRKR